MFPCIGSKITMYATENIVKSKHLGEYFEILLTLQEKELFIQEFLIFPFIVNVSNYMFQVPHIA